MRLNPELEQELKSIAFKYLKKGKHGWDIPHTIASVNWMRKLIEKEGGDERILVTAMYLHDIGYPHLQEGHGFDDMMKAKSVHEELGVKEAEKILKTLNEYSNDEIKEILWLVRHHDTLNKITTKPSGQLLMEADSLAAIDWERVTPTFDKEDCFKYLEYFKKTRINKFSTKTGKKHLKKILKKAENYFN